MSATPSLRLLERGRYTSRRCKVHPSFPFLIVVVVIVVTDNALIQIC